MQFFGCCFPSKQIQQEKMSTMVCYADADFNSRTGFGGIDYQVEIRWNNETKKWNKVIESWSPNGETRVVENKTDYKDFYENGSNYVLLSADLGKMLHPEKYK